MATSSPLLVLDANGQPRIEPSVSSRWTFDISTTSRFVAQRDVVHLAYMEGGPANELVAYIDDQEIRSVYDPENLGILGTALVSFLKVPSFDYNIRGAYRIYVLRLGKPTPASLTLLDPAVAPVLLLTSKDAGSYVNKISVEVASGTTIGKRITVRFRQEQRIWDNLQNAMHLAYTGNATAATLTITRTADRATRLQTALTGATDGSINLDLDLTQDAFASVQQLVTYLNGQNGYRSTIDRYGSALLPTYELDGVASRTIQTPVALLIHYVGAGSAAAMQTTNTTLATVVTGTTGENLTIDLTDPATDTLGKVVAYISSLSTQYTCTLGPNADMDALAVGLFNNVTGQDIRTTTYPLTAQPGAMDDVLTAYLGSIVFVINAYEPRLSATRVAGASTAPANVAQTFLAGGTNPVPTNADWLSALDVVNREDLIGGLVFPVTTSQVVQDATNAWITEQHTSHGKAYRGFFASPDFTSPQDAKSLALAFNNTLDGLMTQPMVAADGLTEFAPIYQAAMYCGAAAGALPTQSVTRLVLRGVRLPDRAKFSKTTREDLLSNGVTVLEDVKGIGVRISLAVTTSLSQDRIDRILSESMVRDVIEQRVKAYVEPLIPHWADLEFMATVKGSVYGALNSLEQDKIITKGIDANGRLLPAYLPVQVHIQGGIMRITLHVFIGGEVDHILVFGTLTYQVFNLTIPAG